MTDTIRAMFDNLDAWRHLPAYQLERRADVFFAAYLPELLGARFGNPPRHIIPEFPVHIPTIYSKARGNLSFKIDYLAVFPSTEPPLFVELKTDQSSRRTKQDWYLSRAVEVGLPKLLTGLKRIYKATKSKPKYEELFRQLASAGLIELRGKGLFDVLAPQVTPRLLYIQPNPQPDQPTLAFVEIAEYLDGKQDLLSQRFARSLRDWATREPGTQFPAA